MDLIVSLLSVLVKMYKWTVLHSNMHPEKCYTKLDILVFIMYDFTVRLEKNGCVSVQILTIFLNFTGSKFSYWP